MRREEDVFGELSKLCTSPGYIHAIAYLCYRDNMVSYGGQIKAKDMLPLFSMKRLIRTEISTLLGLMIKAEVTYELPVPSTIQDYIERTEALLEEMHEILSKAFVIPGDEEEGTDPQLNPFTTGEVLREPIFYSGESAYSFQYRDLAPRKYAPDDAWLTSNKGFSIKEARDVVRVIGTLQEQKVMSTLAGFHSIPPEQWTILPGYTFSIEEATAVSSLNNSTVTAVLSAFSLPPHEKNQDFRTLHDFNATNATPLLRTNDGRFILLQIYSLVEALYDSPFYWMVSDKQYQSVAMRNRGIFTEQFCSERLELVFGKPHVHVNVDLFETKGKKAGEIDVLVFFGNRAVVLQAKSKRLTIEARKGNDGQIRDDFKKSVQDSYDQAVLCAKKLHNPNVRLFDSRSRAITVPRELREIYIICVVSDHYPALSFQARQFLEYEGSDQIRPPLILDVFAFDAITEMLPSPVRLLSYLNQRARYTDKLIASHELTILSYHLRHNLWLSDEIDQVLLSDDITVDLDVAMTVRREGLPGKEIPAGILTRFESTVLGRVVREIEASPDSGTIELAFLLLTLSEETVLKVSEGLRRLARLAQRDDKSHDLTVVFDTRDAGLTVHCNRDPITVAGPRLQHHCELRKYSERANRWFGICIHPSDESLRFGVNLDYKWEPSASLELKTQHLASSVRLAESLASIGRRRKVGRNDPCPCGSGKKHKKCCMGK